MSYEIIYNAFSVRQGEAVIPYVIHGSNNCTTYDNITGRERRERNLSPMAWLYSNDLRQEVELQGRDIKTLLDANISKEWEGGNIQGLSLNSMIKRVSNIILDNEILGIKTQINMFYFEGTLAQKDRIEELAKQYNKLIDRILLKHDRAELKNKFIDELKDDVALQSAFKEYVADGYFWHDELNNEYLLNQELAKFKNKRVAKEYDMNMVKDAMLKHGHIPTIAEGHGFIVDDYGSLLEGTLKALNEPTQKIYGVSMGFYPKGRRNRFKILNNNRFVSIKQIG